MPLAYSNSSACVRVDDEALTSYAERICLPALLASQNADGGWGFRAGAESRVEPTSWALLALAEHAHAPDVPGVKDAAARGLRFLEAAQLADGSWPAAAGQNTGSWVTSLACCALLAQQAGANLVARGLAWLCAERPGDSGFAWRLRSRLRGKRNVSAQNDFLYGWSWTHATASWVEPTSYALIALQAAPPEMQPTSARQRIAIAHSMLFDRMCPGGGWNCGNPVVYGVAGEPQVGPTVWALLALRDQAERPEVQASLAWLETNLPRVRTLGSYALTQIAFRALQHRSAAPEDRASEFAAGSEGAPGVCESAWTILAASGDGRFSKFLRSGKS
jgi:hypothetical protein